MKTTLITKLKFLFGITPSAFNYLSNFFVLKEINEEKEIKFIL